MKRMVALFFAFMMMASCSMAMADEGTKTDGDFLFNNLAWGTNKDDVFKAITEMCSGIEIKAEEEEIEFGNLLQVICTYKNKQSGESICKVGEMEVKQIVAEYLCEDGKYDYALYAISCQSEDRSSFENMLEMYQASLGSLYDMKDIAVDNEHQVISGQEITWKNSDETQTVSIVQSRNKTDAFGYRTGNSKPKFTDHLQIWFTNVEMEQYLQQKTE